LIHNILKLKAPSLQSGKSFHPVKHERILLFKHAVFILRAVQFCALPVSIEKGIRPRALLPAFFPVS
jgi:hypothetical protein